MSCGGFLELVAISGMVSLSFIFFALAIGRTVYSIRRKIRGRK